MFQSNLNAISFMENSQLFGDPQSNTSEFNMMSQFILINEPASCPDKDLSALSDEHLQFVMKLLDGTDDIQQSQQQQQDVFGQPDCFFEADAFDEQGTKIPLFVQEQRLDSDALSDRLSSSPDLFNTQMPTQSQQPKYSEAASTIPTSVVFNISSCVSCEPGDQTVPMRSYEDFHRLPTQTAVDSTSHPGLCSVSESDLPQMLSFDEDSMDDDSPSQSCQSPSGVKRGRPYSSSDDTEGLSEKKLRRREQNRRAATKCRNKRRTEFETLKKNHDAVIRENEKLRDELGQLSCRFDRLQAELIQHQLKCRFQTSTPFSI